MMTWRRFLILPLMLASAAVHSQPTTRSLPGIMPVSVPPSVPPKSPKGTIRTESRNGYTLAFVDADVRRVVDAVLGSMLGADYSIDPKVQGTITLRTAKPVEQSGLVPLLETALRSVDAVILAEGGRYRIVPREAARSHLAMAGSRVESGPGYSTEAITLRFGSAREVSHLIEQFVGKDVVAGTEPAYNQILITGSADERQAARALIARFDVDTLAGMNFAFYKLENVDAETLVGELERIFKAPYDILAGRIRVVPLPRLRAVLIIARDRNDLDRLDPWIKRLDEGGSGKRKLYSYAVQNGRAREIAAALQLVLGVQATAPATIAPGSSGSGGLGEASQRLGDAGSLGQGSGTTTALSGTGVGAVEPSQAIGAETPLPGASTPVLQPGNGSGPRIVPNDDTNSLLIYANGEEYDLIKSALDKIDLPVSQVLIEATLAEVTLTKDFSAGVDWSVLSGNSAFKLNNTASATPTAIFPGFSYSYLGATAKVVLNTLQSKTRVKVLSAPKLIVLNNQTATLQVGDQVPIISQQSQSVAAAGAPIVNSVELRDTGVILKVTPRVNDSGAVQLDIAQEVSDVTPTTTSGINSPTIQQRRLATTVVTRSGQMIALGGLIRSTISKQKSGFPILSQIPILGAAFGNQVDRADQTELIILLTPTVIRSPQDVRGVVDELLDRMDSTRPLVEQAKAKQVGASAPR